MKKTVEPIEYSARLKITNHGPNKCHFGPSGAPTDKPQFTLEPGQSAYLDSAMYGWTDPEEKADIRILE